jgi:hypothetical protein
MSESTARNQSLFSVRIALNPPVNTLQLDGVEDKAQRGRKPEHRIRGQDQAAARRRADPRIRSSLQFTASPDRFVGAVTRADRQLPRGTNEP